MTWLAVMTVASAAPIKSDVDHTLLQTHLLPYCNPVYSLLHQNIPESTFEALELSLMNAPDSLGGVLFRPRQEGRG